MIDDYCYNTCIPAPPIVLPTSRFLGQGGCRSVYICGAGKDSSGVKLIRLHVLIGRFGCYQLPMDLSDPNDVTLLVLLDLACAGRHKEIGEAVAASGTASRIGV
jgi:hypothetical protein